MEKHEVSAFLLRPTGIPDEMHRYRKEHVFGKPFTQTRRSLMASKLDSA
jgi:hypothetical protein